MAAAFRMSNNSGPYCFSSLTWPDLPPGKGGLADDGSIRVHSLQGIETAACRIPPRIVDMHLCLHDLRVDRSRIVGVSDRRLRHAQQCRPGFLPGDDEVRTGGQVEVPESEAEGEKRSAEPEPQAAARPAGGCAAQTGFGAA